MPLKLLLILLLLWLPILVTLLNFKISIAVINCFLSTINLDIRDPHLSLGDYVLMLYFIVGPILQITTFEYFRAEHEIGVFGRSIVWGLMILTSMLASFFYINAISWIK
jgi:hypothetical protein